MMKQLTTAVVLAALASPALSQNLMGDRTAGQIIAEFEATAEAPAFAMPTLNIGDEPPAFKIAHWSKGAPISEFEKGNVYLLDFWATWCGPCIAIMPHLSELQTEHAEDGLTVVGVSIWERGRTEDGQRYSLEGEEHAAHVDAFVEKNDAKMEYTVAVGNKDIENDWMRAAHQGGIPTVMIVDRDSRVGWIGYGTDPALDEHLQAILAEEHDYKALNEARIESIKAEQAERGGPNHYAHFTELAKTDRAAAGAFGQAILETVYKGNPNAYNAVAWTIVENEGWSADSIEYARKIAHEACEITEWNEPAVMGTLAWAQYRNGDTEAAIKTELKAIELIDEDDPQIESYKVSLATFQGG